MFEINDGLSRMWSNPQVRFLEGKGAVKLPTYLTVNKGGINIIDSGKFERYKRCHLV